MANSYLYADRVDKAREKAEKELVRLIEKYNYLQFHLHNNVALVSEILEDLNKLYLTIEVKGDK